MTQWWMGTGSPIDLTSAAARDWWRESAKRVLELGVEGIKADDGEGYYIPDEVRLADGRTGAQAAWSLGGLHRRCLQDALDEVHPGAGVLFGRSAWTGQHATGFTWAGDQASDFWSLRVLVVATLTAACSGLSILVPRCRRVPRAPAGRALPARAARPLAPVRLLYAADAGARPDGPGAVELRRAGARRLPGLRAAPRAAGPYVRAAAATAARSGLPIIRPLCLVDPADPRGWTIGDAYGYGPALWVAPVLDDGAREREVALPRGEWIETWSGDRVRGGSEVVVKAPLDRIPVWVRRGSIVVTYPAGTSRAASATLRSPSGRSRPRCGVRHRSATGGATR